MNVKNLAPYLFSVLLLIGGISIYHYGINNNQQVLKIEHIDSTQGRAALYAPDENGNLQPLNFTNTAEEALKAVVHIKSTKTGQATNALRGQTPSPFKDFFGDQFFRFESPQTIPNQPRVGTGSGVIINSEGYIVTNNHVIDDSDDLEVTLNDNRSYKATVIGTDPTTDLALIQIDENNLPTLPLADSDNIRIGEWVMAVGNPMGLNSTVTAGIISAKGRSINILREKFAVESFIQTDAAINPGNSGGALVNTDGALVGINTAIASQTGSYTGYGFAVPSNIVSKVIEDLLAYGSVQRGILGVMIRTVDGNLANQKGLNINNGVYVDSLLNNSAAKEAGIKTGDVITQVNGSVINTSPELTAKIAQYRPGDQITVTINRAGKIKDYEVTLAGRNLGPKIASKEDRMLLSRLGIDIEEVPEEVLDKVGISNGIIVRDIYSGLISRNTRMKEGFIITKINGKKVKSVDEFLDLLRTINGGVMVEGIYEASKITQYYAFGLDA